MKNFWSLQVGEAIVAEEIKQQLGKDYEVFIPLNNQLKDIDLIFANMKNNKYKTIQVKESRAYSLGDDVNGWFTIAKNKFEKTTIHVDYYIFLLYRAKATKTKYVNTQEFIIVPFDYLKSKSKDKKAVKGRLHYYFRIRENEVAEVREKGKEYDYSKFLNNFKLLE